MLICAGGCFFSSEDVAYAQWYKQGQEPREHYVSVTLKGPNGGRITAAGEDADAIIEALKVAADPANRAG